jgi:hypothetical protein
MGKEVCYGQMETYTKASSIRVTLVGKV